MPELTKSSKQSNPSTLEGNGEEGAHHKQLNITLVKVSEGTDTPHEDKPPSHTLPSTIKYNKLQKGPPEIKERETDRHRDSNSFGCSHNAHKAILGQGLEEAWVDLGLPLRGRSGWAQA